jgi:hypothetical protein
MPQFTETAVPLFYLYLIICEYRYCYIFHIEFISHLRKSLLLTWLSGVSYTDSNIHGVLALI